MKTLALQPLQTVDSLKKFDVKAKAHGGGLVGQAGALSLALARALDPGRSRVAADVEEARPAPARSAGEGTEEVGPAGRAQALPVLQTLGDFSACYYGPKRKAPVANRTYGGGRRFGLFRPGIAAVSRTASGIPARPGDFARPGGGEAFQIAGRAAEGDRRTLFCGPGAPGSGFGERRRTLFFLALPHGAAAPLRHARCGAEGKLVVDLSADFRTADAAVYREFYGQDHPAPELLPEAVYGLPELHRERAEERRS